MAIAGDTHHIPSMPIHLDDHGRIKFLAWATNKPRELVERDIDKAVQRLLAGQRFEMYCSGPQIPEVIQRLKGRRLALWWWRVERRLIRFEKWQGWR